MRVHDQRLISSIWDIVKSKDTLAKPASQPTASSPAVPTDSPAEVSPAAVNGSKKSPNASGEEEARIDHPNKKLKANGHSDHMDTSAASLEPSLNEGNLSAETSAKFKWKKAIKNVLSEADGFTMSGKNYGRRYILIKFTRNSSSFHCGFALGKDSYVVIHIDLWFFVGIEVLRIFVGCHGADRRLSGVRQSQVRQVS